MGYSGTAFFLNGSYGGTDENQKFGVKDLIPSNFGSGPTGYTTTGMGVNPFGFGVHISMVLQNYFGLHLLKNSY